MVLIDFCHYLVPDSLVFVLILKSYLVLRVSENRLKLLLAYEAIFIQIKDIKCDTKIFFV